METSSEDETAAPAGYKSVLYASYTAERKDINETALKISERFDKNILIVGGGALAVSLTFLEKIAPNPSIGYLWILGVSWFFLVVSILTHLMALAYGQRAIRRQMEILDNDYSRYLSSPTPEEEVRKRTAHINTFSMMTGLFSEVSLWTVVVGVFLLCLFSILSLVNKTKSENEQRITNTQPDPGATATVAAAPAAAATTNSRNAGVIRAANQSTPAAAAQKVNSRAEKGSVSSASEVRELESTATTKTPATPILNSAPK